MIIQPFSGIDLASPQKDGLVAAWPLNDGGGLVARDALSRYPGTLTNGPTWATGPLGGALSFDGSNDYVNVGTVNPLAFTYTAWIRFASLKAYTSIISKWEGIVPANVATLLIKSNGKLACYVGSSYYDGSGAYTLSAGVWYFVALAYDASIGIRGYINGRIDGTAGTGGTLNTGQEIWIGSHPSIPGRDFEGLICDVRIYNRALPAAEVQQIYLRPQDLYARPAPIILWGSAAAAALAGAVSGAGAAAGALTTRIAAAGSVTGAGAAAGALTTRIAAAGALAGSGAASGALTTRIAAAGAVAGAGAPTGSLTTAIRLAAAVQGQGAVSGTVSLMLWVSGSVAGAGAVSGTLTRAGAALAAEVLGVGTLTGRLTTAIPLAGSVAGLGLVVGALSIVGTRAVAVRLARADGAPLVGVTVTARALVVPLGSRGAVAGPGQVSAVTDANGTALLELLPAGFAYRLSAEHAGLAVLDQELEVPDAAGSEAAAHVRPTRWH